MGVSHLSDAQRYQFLGCRVRVSITAVVVAPGAVAGALGVLRAGRRVVAKSIDEAALTAVVTAI